MEAVRASDKFSRAYEGLAGGVSAVEVYAPSADAR
jgi:hypothetical protein